MDPIVKELLEYLHGKIDPRDPLNPAYAKIHEQIAAIEKAANLTIALEPIKMCVDDVPEWLRAKLSAPLKTRL